MADLLYISVKLLTGFIGLWLMTRLLGKKEIAQLTPFDFISSLMLSEIVGNTVYDKEVHFSRLLYALAFWALLSFTLEKVTYKFKTLRRPLDGSPVLLIEDGKVNVRQMHRNNMDFEQLQMMLRQRDVFSIREVAYALLETNGGLSVLKKSGYDQVTREDFDLPEKEQHPGAGLIEDGEIQKEQLLLLGKDELWLRKELINKGYGDAENVLYAEWRTGEGLYVAETAEHEGRRSR
ncbi:DUF421 domain-containing protein [Paenibacillus gansuensis]|uniref:DUF421 domain-containing protein n=1 Tax=Paenibacillus gansuensis TaxID=306542 RepID=A0ABW5P847_9BACL